jgi:hypothetical protein
LTALHVEPNACALKVTAPIGRPFKGSSVLAPAATFTLLVTVCAPAAVTRMHVPSGGAFWMAKVALPVTSPPSAGAEPLGPLQPAAAAISEPAAAAPNRGHGRTRFKLRVLAFLICETSVCRSAVIALRTAETAALAGPRIDTFGHATRSSAQRGEILRDEPEALLLRFLRVPEPVATER